MDAQGPSTSLDQTTNLALIAPIHAGLAPAVEPILYVERLHRLLDALHTSRRNQRESELLPRLFPDSIGRHGIIHSFRYAIWSQPPARDHAPATAHLTLNVSFDGGWEPYMRVIYRDLGPLLDALLCHCVGYPGSRKVDFDTYCRWVRQHELERGTFYTDSPATAADAHVGALIERNLLQAGDTLSALPTLKQQQDAARKKALADPISALALPFRTLKGLYRLAPYFDGEHAPILLRFARLVLKEPIELLAQLSPAGQPPPDALKQPLAIFADELAWLLPQPAAPGATPPQQPSAPAFDPADVQQAVLLSTDQWTHGCMALLHVRDPDAAVVSLRDLARRCGAEPSAKSANHQIAFTGAGLRALNIDPDLLGRFPAEFMQGMEARSGVLGDVRTNHPNAWRRPVRAGAAADSGDRIDLRSVHVVVMLRCADLQRQPLNAMHPMLSQAAHDLAHEKSGLQLIALEPMHSRAKASVEPGRLHFGFVDGLSQPVLRGDSAGAAWSDVVPPGELFLGFANNRDEPELAPQVDALRQSGSFLVLRVLRQRVERLEAVLKQAPDPEDALARMMGRSCDGVPQLAPQETRQDNSFDYAHDAAGRHCPFQSHIRRGNPRDGRAYIPRILRRGMSYGPWISEEPQAERGIYFMAYCASIAEQFETLQQWMAAGNSSGMASRLSDPFLGVPAAGEDRIFRYVDGRDTEQRLNLGKEPLVELQWGLYLFVPGLAALRSLPAFARIAGPRAVAPVALPFDGSLEDWRSLLEDRDGSPRVWAAVRERPEASVAAGAFGQLVGRRKDVVAALGEDGIGKLSVAGYADRMAATIGLNYLGLDSVDGHEDFARVLNPIVQGVCEEDAFNAALPVTVAVLRQFAVLDRPSGLQEGDERIRRPVDLMSLSEIVMARLCHDWFGLPDDLALGPDRAGALMKYGGATVGKPVTTGLPRCPRDVYSSSRTVFGPHPRPETQDRAHEQGPRVLDSVRRYLAAAGPKAPLTEQLRTALLALPRVAALDAEAQQDVIACNVAGMLLGFPPTVHGNFLQTMKTWIEGETLWDHQQALSDAWSRQPTYAAARDALRSRLLDTMWSCPIPEVLWRQPVVGGHVDMRSERRVVLGVRSALADRGTAVAGTDRACDELMFGGSCDVESPIFGVHACPGYGMGVGVMLGMIAGLLQAGTLLPTGSPVLLMLNPRKPAAAPAPPPPPQTRAAARH